MRIIDHDRKLKEFMTAKCEDRAELLGFSIQHALRREERERNNEKGDIIQVRCQSIIAKMLTINCL